MEAVQAPFLMAAAVAAAGIAGGLAGSTLLRRRDATARRERLRKAADVRDAREGFDSGSRLVRYATALSQRIALGATEALSRRLRLSRARAWFCARAKRAGLEQAVSPEGFCEASMRLACAGGLAGALVGLRSGLSFDRGFALYGSHFDSDLARACVGAQHAWSLGLTNREDALRDLAASYDSPLFARVVESMVRSLRFGSSLAEGLESAAAEARAVHRAQVEERVAKAPVKMMVPTGTLILPAMLLLVLGPVLLELMEGM